MLYLIALLVPPLALLLVGKPFQALLALILQATLIGWLPAAIWAMLVVQGHYADQRANRLIRELRRGR